MKNLILFMLLCISISVSAQTKPCNLNDGRMHHVYVFSETRNHTMPELFGEEVNPATVFIQYIATAEQKARLDSLCLAGQAEDAVFIFPDKDVSKTRRYCKGEEYRAVLLKK